MKSNKKTNRSGKPRWTFLSNYGHVLLCLHSEPELSLKEIAHKVGITERAVHRIVADLEEDGYLARHRQGRKNYYTFSLDRPLRHPLEAHKSIKALLRLI